MSDNAATEAAASPAAVSKVEAASPVMAEKSDAVADTTNGIAKTEASEEAKNDKTEKAAEVAAGHDVTEESSLVKDESVDEEANANFERKSRYNDRKDDRDRRSGGRYGYGHGQKRKFGAKNTEFDDLPETDDPVEIRNQVEFYFSLHNLRTDEHMFQEIGGSKNRPVTIKHIHSFKRMRHFQPYKAIVAALRESDDLVVVDDGDFSGLGNEGVKRKAALTIPPRDGDEDRRLTVFDEFQRLKSLSRNSLDSSIYAKDFGPEEKAGQIALENFFKPYGAVVVRKRRDEDNKWKGSVFVEFDSEDSAKQFLELDPRPKFNDEHELTVESKKAYSERKCAEKGITPAWERESGAGESRGFRDNRRGGRGGRGGRGRGRGGDRRNSDRYGRENRRRRRDRSSSRSSEDSRDWNSRREKFQKSKDYRGSRKNDRQRSATPEGYRRDDKGIIVDGSGVPLIRDSRTKESNKRKADDDQENDSPKKTKLEIKEDA